MSVTSIIYCPSMSDDLPEPSRHSDHYTTRPPNRVHMLEKPENCPMTGTDESLPKHPWQEGEIVGSYMEFIGDWMAMTTCKP